MSQFTSVQDAFDQTYAYLRSMTRQAVDHGGACIYGSRDGARCAVGHWLSFDVDDEFCSTAPGLLFHYPQAWEDLAIPDLTHHQVECFWQAMQSLHDDEESWHRVDTVTQRYTWAPRHIIKERFEERLRDAEITLVLPW